MKLQLLSRLSHQLGLAFGVVVLFVFVVLVTALVTQQLMLERMKQIVDVDSVRAERAVDVARYAYESALAMRNLSVINNPSELGDEYTRLLTHVKSYDAAWATLTELLLADTGTSEEVQQIKVVQKSAATTREIFALATANAQGTAADDYAIGIRTELRRDLTRWNQALTDWISAINDLRTIEVQRGRNSVAEMIKASSISRGILITTSLLAAVVGIAAACFVIRSISRSMNMAVQTANRIANGDLSHDVEVSGSGEIAELLAALKNMQASLVDIVTAVRSGAQGVATSTEEIVAGNLDLSRRTEQQASALEHITSSMVDFHAQINKNLENAKGGHDLAASSSEISALGGNSVEELVQTMHHIQTSSNRVAAVVDLIDSIAFQTNILALNAAVEAARAGDQGRGFAVVASEVRNLASRSAVAAQEIKGIIGSSLEQVETGSTLGDQVTARMTEVVASIAHVTKVVQDISSASHQQNEALSHIRQAVQSMDTVTHQNAAMVEQVAAASAQLKALAQQQVISMSIFRLPS